MIRIVWLSDLHFSVAGPVQGYDPEARLAAALDQVRRHHADAAACVISGDLVDRGTAQDYAALADRLSALPMPVLPLMGNHDDRGLLRAALTVPQPTLPGFVQYRVDLGEVVLLCLDTHVPGADHGALCAARSAWLLAELQRSPDQQALIFMHHPPLSLGLPMQDQDRMIGGDALLSALQSFRDRVHLCIGHVHRPISGTVQGIGFTTMRSVLYQAPPPRPEWIWAEFQPAQEAAAFGVIEASRRGVVIQFYQAGSDA
jgi:3',5'-cyclic AMP phosphodiesterase CpdA